jgi:uncharacterized protein YuzB (UPF0349 family)
MFAMVNGDVSDGETAGADLVSEMELLAKRDTGVFRYSGR